MSMVVPFVYNRRISKADLLVIPAKPAGFAGEAIYVCNISTSAV